MEIKIEEKKKSGEGMKLVLKWSVLKRKREKKKSLNKI
jgi:hypothetical protein